MPHPVENIMKGTMEQLRELVDVNTIVGNPVVTGGDTVVLPVSKVSLGFMSGGGEYQKSQPVKRSGEMLDGREERFPFAGTAVAGMSITPIAFLAVRNESVRVYPAQNQGALERVIDMIPDAISAIERMITGPDGETGDSQPDGEEGT